MVYNIYWLPSEARFGRDPVQRVSVRSPKWFFMHNRLEDSRRLIDWRNDPLDKFDLSAKHPDQADWMAHLANQFAASMTQAHQKTLAP